MRKEGVLTPDAGAAVGGGPGRTRKKKVQKTDAPFRATSPPSLSQFHLLSRPPLVRE